MNLEGLTEKRRGTKSLWYENECGDVAAKRCSNCGSIKSIDEYRKDSRGVGGRHAKCGYCESKFYSENLEYYSEYRKNNKENIYKHAKNWRDKNPDYNRKRYEENKDYWYEYNKDWRQENLDKIREYNRKQYAENKERVIESTRKW